MFKMADEEYSPPPGSPSADEQSVDVGNPGYLETIVIKPYMNILQTAYKCFSKKIPRLVFLSLSMPLYHLDFVLFIIV